MGLSALLLLVSLLATTQVPVGAATIATGPTPTDTAIRTDGTMSFILASGNSTLTVVDPTTHNVISVINLAQPINTCFDIDWHDASQRLYVGCTTGLVLSVDPVLMTVLPLINNPAANYAIISADNYAPGTVGWGYDANTGWLHQFLPGGIWVPTMPLALGAMVELKEKRVDPLFPIAQDSYLMAVGTCALGFVDVQCYDRLVLLATGVATWGTGARNATGITSATTVAAFVSAAMPAGGAGVICSI